MAQRVGRAIALLFHDRGTRRGCVVSSTPQPHFTPGKDPVLILQEAGWAPGPVWTGGKSRPHRDSIPDRLARSSVAIPTELPGPHSKHVAYVITLCNKSSCADVNYLALRYIPESSTEIYRINMFQLSAFRRWQKISEMN